MAGVQTLRTVKADCHEATVTTLRDMLARAEAGEVVGFVGSLECAHHYEYVCTVPVKAQAVGMLEMAKGYVLGHG